TRARSNSLMTLIRSRWLASRDAPSPLKPCVRLPIGDDEMVSPVQGASVDFSDRHVVVTGGTGALGTAVADALAKAGAICHVPYVEAAEAERFPLRGH